MTSSYVLLVVARAVVPTAEAITLRARVPRIREAVALALSLMPLLLGLFPCYEYLTIPATARQ